MRRSGDSLVFLRAGLCETSRVEVNFGDWLELAGLRLSQDRAGINLLLHWRSLRKTYWPWRCFVHILSGDKQISSVDHPIGGDRHPTQEWNPGDQGWQELHHWLDAPPTDLAIRLGIYDPEVNVRCSILASTVPVVDEASAILVKAKESPGNSRYFLRLEPAPFKPCGVVFESGLELTAYALVFQDGYAWLRLKWTLRGRPRRGLRFFCHVVAEPEWNSPTLGQFDQDLQRECRGPATVVEQHVVRQMNREVVWLRAGVFQPSNLKRLPIVSSPLPDDPAQRCFYMKTQELRPARQ